MISVNNVSKVYPDGTRAVSNLNLEIENGEFVAFVGPSGCGKTTALRMVAGLEDVTEGQIVVAGRDVTHVDAGERDIAMVFQNYALYPHMTVRKNLAFGMVINGAPRNEIKSRVSEVAELLGLTDHLDRRPQHLSGGQRQRVAMGRAIIRRPNAFLMDEPLSNLDAKLRVQMRVEIKRLQSEIGTTTIYVTHDQIEAMTMGDRIAVMLGGVLQQFADPDTIYDAPANVFVAGFMGSPSMNLFPVSLSGDGAEISVDCPGGRLRLPDGPAQAFDLPRGGTVTMGVRPEDITVVPKDAGGGGLMGELVFAESLGAERLSHVRIGTAPTRASGTTKLPDEEEAADGLLQVRSPRTSQSAATKGPVICRLDMARLQFFDATSGLSLRRPA